MYVDLNPVRAAMAQSPDSAQHTSAYDRIQAKKGKRIESAAFQLVAASTEETGKAIQKTPVSKLKSQRKLQRKNPTGKQIPRDGWLAPLSLKKTSATNAPQPNRAGVRASDRGFLEIALDDYLALLRWTAKQTEPAHDRKVPPRLAPLLARLGIDLAMWRDLVWNFKRYFGRSSCAGSPAGMAAYAEATGRHWARGQRGVAECFG
jgi:hypothetical protein